MEKVLRFSLARLVRRLAARFRTRALCQEIGLGLNAVEALATAVTEVARNVIVHARSGEVLLGTVRDGDLRGVVVIAKDEGPGIVIDLDWGA